MLIAILLLFISAFSKAQIINNPPFRFEHFNSDQGLSTSTITGIIKDHRGFIWICSIDAINRYDGYEFKIFKTDPEDSTTISAGKPMGIAEDKNGIIWIACAIPQGLNSYNPVTGKFKRYSEDSAYKKLLPSKRMGLLVDSSNVLWMFTEGEGIYSWNLNTKVFKQFHHDAKDSSTIATEHPNGYAIAPDGNLFIYFDDDIDLFDVNTGKCKHYPLHLKDKIPEYAAWAYGISCDSKGNVLIGSSNGLLMLNPSTNKLAEFNYNDKTPSIASDEVHYAKEAPDGKIWIEFDSGLNIYDPNTKTFSEYKHDDLDANSISNHEDGRLYFDNSGVAWLQGAYPVNKVDLAADKFNPVRHDDDKNLPNADHYIIAPRCLYADRSGKIIVGLSDGIREFNPATKKYGYFPNSDTLHNPYKKNKALHIFQDRDSVYWINYDYDKLVSYNPLNHQWETFHYKEDHALDSLGVWSIADMYQDRHGKIWMGGSDNLCVYDPDTKKFKSYWIDPSSRKQNLVNYVSAIMEPGDGKIWFGSIGLSYYDEKRDTVLRVFFSQNNAARILSKSRITCSLDADNGCEWIGTNSNGLFLIDLRSGRCKRISAHDGLPNEVIFGIMRDAHKNLWLTTNNGICKFTPSANLFDSTKSGVFRNYDRSDGIPVKECSGPYCETSDGTMFFTSAEVVSFHPDSLKDNSFTPPVYITDFKLFNKSVSVSDVNSVLKSTIETTKEITLTYKQNIFTFTFAALSFVHPENNKYAYKLDGFDKDWTYTDALHRYANYTNLDAGEYIFEVKGSNNDGVWNETPTTIHLIITPPWWQTWWFRIFVIIMVAGILYTLYKNRINQLLRVQDIRNKIASDLHDDIGSTLNSISVYSEVAKQDPSRQTESLDMIGEASRKVIEAMSDIVWSINPTNDSFENIILRMRSLAYNLFRAINIEHTFRADEHLDVMKLSMEERRNFYLIFKEAINNLVKYSNADGAKINISQDHKLITLTITDNGIGFDATKQYNGNGLNNMRQRAEEIHAVLNIQSAIGEGTTIELKLKT